MQPGPELAAAIADPRAQARDQAVMADAFRRWRDDPATAPVLAAFAAFAGGAPFAALDPLAALLGAGGEPARRFAQVVADTFLPALAAAPLGQVPLRHHRERGLATVLLAREGDASLTLVAWDGHALAAAPAPRSVCFAPADEWDVVLAGRGQASLVTRQGPALARHPLTLGPGVALGREAHAEALIVEAAAPALVMLRLQRRRAATRPVQEFDLASGALLHQASATPAESRHEIAVALLGAMGRTDAAPRLGEIATDRRHGEGLRWQALRQCLGLDTDLGFRALCAIAAAPADGLAVPAGALRASLVERHPMLQALVPCPA